MRSEIILGLCLTVLAGCAAKAQIVPIQEQVLLLREDGCKGPAELQNYMLVSKASLDEVEDLLQWCQKEKYLAPMKPVNVIFVPETIQCPDIPNAALQEYLAMVTKEDLTYVLEQIEECATNFEERELQKEKDAHSARI